MGEVNLLPWREWQRLRSVRRWQAAMLACLAGGLLLALVLAAALGQRLQHWVADNERLERGMAGLAEGLEHVVALKARGNELQAQLDGLSVLQAQRTFAGDLLSRLMAIVPPGVHLEELKWAEGELQLSGLARSGADVAQLLRSLRQSPGLDAADLQTLTSTREGERFRLQAGRQAPTSS